MLCVHVNVSCPVAAELVLIRSLAEFGPPPARPVLCIVPYPVN